MLLAGVAIQSNLVLELAELLIHSGSVETAATLLRADANDQTVVALTIDDRERILDALDDAPPGLEELRGVLLREASARARGEMA